MAFIRPVTSGRRGAILSMELVLILPIILVLIFSIVEFSMLMSAQTRVANAAQNGARLMSLCTYSDQEVQETVRSQLGPELAADSEIVIQPAIHAGEIGRVTIRVPMSKASPDLLWMTGFSLQNRFINADVPMVMERTAVLDRAWN
jgi:Flp pilus assembly protein TadG